MTIFKDWCFMNSQPTFLFFNLFLTQLIMVILSKGCKQDNFEPHNSVKKYLRPSFQFCSLWIFPWIKLFWNSCSMWDKLGWLNWFWQFLCKGLSSFNPKRFHYSYAWPCSLCERRTSFCTELMISGKLFKFLLVFDWLYLIQCITPFSYINHLLCRYARFLILFHLT